MTAPRTDRRGSPLLAVLSAILLLADAGLAALGMLVFNSHQRGNLTDDEAATFLLLGVSAAAGTVIFFLTAVAFALPRGRRVARIAAVLAWLRTAGVLIAVAATVTSFGASAIIGAFETVGLILTAADTLAALIVTGIAVRRT
ncbi:hypothetical protein [Paractinoplanes rishiriensis]|uniref:Uncharacterized protein n=1 Tax=Paractinoplanes rishiriensis TaxID=1050105 RepID=A0A919KA86_9ACTN|nr:hypothetical protein [Actinoplanes rishiriensis]GIF01585.1 hypothetical protein Ari01nite_90490 [Actinoplanes rishiriensis]